MPTYKCTAVVSPCRTFIMLRHDFKSVQSYRFSAFNSNSFYLCFSADINRLILGIFCSGFLVIFVF